MGVLEENLVHMTVATVDEHRPMPLAAGKICLEPLFAMFDDARRQRSPLGCLFAFVRSIGLETMEAEYELKPTSHQDDEIVLPSSDASADFVGNAVGLSSRI